MVDQPRPPRHRLKAESSTWGNVPPYPQNTLHIAVCNCGWRSEWFSYPENLPKECPNEPVAA